jgi:site-specific recombinase XerD
MPGANPSSHTLHVRDGYRRADADELDQRIRRIKRENNGHAHRWMVFGGPDPDREMPTVRDFALGRFLEYVTRNLKPRTQKDYSHYLDHAILYDVKKTVVVIDGKKKVEKTFSPSRLSQMRLDEVRSHHIVEWLDHLADERLPRRSRQLALDTLQSLFARAKERGFVDANPTHGHRGNFGTSDGGMQPVKPSRVVDPISVERLRRSLELVGAMRNWMILGLMTYLGLRPNEVVVLYWHELVDASGKAREFIELERGSSDGVEGPTKTGKYRLVRVFEPVREDIERYFEWCGCIRAHHFSWEVATRQTPVRRGASLKWQHISGIPLRCALASTCMWSRIQNTAGCQSSR